ncbi:MAG: type II toxin-antitoxin system RelE/ParE family toxin [Acidobacteriota bacterium]
MYKISILKRSEKDIKKLDRSNKNRVVKAIMNLAEEPRPVGCRKILSESGVRRIRVGDWRIGYTIDEKLLEVTIIRVANRGEFYT